MGSGRKKWREEGEMKGGGDRTNNMNIQMCLIGTCLDQCARADQQLNAHD